MTEAYYLSLLRQTFAEHLSRNPRYSVRAFARHLEVDSSVCSQLLSGKRVPSLRVATQLMDRLALDPAQKQAFMQSLGAEKSRLGLKRISPALRKLAALPEKDVPVRRDLSVDAFQTVAQWYHYAILELTKIPGFQESPAWIAEQLGISENEAKLALERLLSLEMLERRKGRLRKTADSFCTKDFHLTTAAHKRRQRDILNRSIEALTHDAIETRNHSGMTVAIDPRRIPEAKKRIREFLKELSDLMETPKPKKVYEIQLSFFSLHSRLDEETSHDS